MSSAGGDPRAGDGYDAAEVRQRIVVCFSASELRRLAESMFAASDVEWGRGVGDAARDLVRHFERRGELGSLVARLREAKPLVEWPEPRGGMPESPFAPPAPPLEPLPSALAVLALSPPSPPPPPPSPPPAPLANPIETSAPAGPPLIDPFLGKPTAPAATVIDAPKGAAPPSDVRAPRPPPASSSRGAGALGAWPAASGGEAPEPSAGGRGIDPKILVAVSAFTLLAALIAFFAGRAGAPPAPASAPGASAASSNGGDAAPDEPKTPAALLANDIARALTNVARACELPVRGEPGEDILLRVFDRCGPQPAPIRPTGPDLSPPSPDSPAAARQNEANTGGPAQRPAGNARPGGNQRPAAPPAEKAPGGECMRSCDAEQRACNGRCGKEPTQSTLYAEYTACLGRCLSGASKCRLSCK